MPPAKIVPAILWVRSKERCAAGPPESKTSFRPRVRSSVGSLTGPKVAFNLQTIGQGWLADAWEVDMDKLTEEIIQKRTQGTPRFRRGFALITSNGARERT